MSDLISRQEVIIALRESGLCYNNWLEVLGVIDAVPNAKEHIKNGDLIRRQDVLNMIIVAGECEPDLGYTHLHKVVENIPSADRPTVDKEYLVDLIQEAVYDGEACAKLIDLVDRPTGEWIDNHNGTFTCDQCGCKHSKSNFCPNCGARMEGGEEE